MTQDYRKRADEFLSWYSNQEVSFSEGVDLFEKELQSLAKESRREENEACAKIADKCGENTADTKYRFGIIIASGLISETIRARMIGPEPMEEK